MFLGFSHLEALDLSVNDIKSIDLNVPPEMWWLCFIVSYYFLFLYKLNNNTSLEVLFPLVDTLIETLPSEVIA